MCSFHLAFSSFQELLTHCGSIQSKQLLLLSIEANRHKLMQSLEITFS